MANMLGEKQFGYSDFTSKVLSLSQSRTKLIEPFPKDIHHILETFFQLGYYTLMFPYRFVYDKTTNQYEVKSNIFQKVFYYILQSTTLALLLLDISTYVLFINPKDSILILQIFGAFGHLFNVLTYLFSIYYYKDSIRDLLNFFVACVPPSSEGSFGGLDQTISYSKESDPDHRESVPNGNLSLWGTVRSQVRTFFSFRNMAILYWLFALQQGILVAFFEYLISCIYRGVIPFSDTETSTIYRALHILFPGFANLPAPMNFIMEGVLVVFMVFERLKYFNTSFIYTLEICVAITVLHIARHFTSVLYNPKNYWKPSSNNVLYSLLIVRQAYRMINRIFGWMMVYTMMGEFPYITFFVVNFYMDQNASAQYIFQALWINQAILLSIATLAAQEMSKVREWLHIEEKVHWAMTNKGSLQRKIVLFELSLDKYALSAHGFFQLSLSALVSIVSAVLSNALIIIQLALSSPSSTNTTEIVSA